METKGFRIAIVGESSLEVQELMAILDRDSSPVQETLRMGPGDSWGNPEDLKHFHEDPAAELLPPLDLERLAQNDVTILARVPKAAREAVIGAALPAGIWVLDLGIEGDGPWADPFGDVASLREAGPLLSLPDPAATYAALLGRALDPFEPALFAAHRFLPASSFGEAGIRELHAQATDLLNFRPAKAEVLSGQTAFNLVSATPKGWSARWVEQVAALWNGCPPGSSADFYASTFHGAGLSMLVKIGGDPADAAAALAETFAAHPALHPAQMAPTPVEAALQGQASFSAEPAGEGWIWIWCAYDNVRAGRPLHAARILATLLGK